MFGIEIWVGQGGRTTIRLRFSQNNQMRQWWYPEWGVPGA